jgi:hypothetical protein
MGIIDSIIQGALTGFGSAIGSYFALKYGIDHFERLPAIKDKARQYKNKIIGKSEDEGGL